jgi:manganese oxidase
MKGVVPMTASLIAMLTALLAALPASDCSHLPVPSGPTAQVNDNRTPAGTLRGGTLTLDLVARPASWYPDGPDGCGLNVFALEEDDSVPSIPGPLIRVHAGTRVRVVLRNSLEHTIQVHGLQDRPAERLDSTPVAPGETHVFEFLATTPGNYFYWARKLGSPPLGSGDDGQLAGALVVDPPDGAPPDRILVLTRWSPPGHLPLGQLPESDPAARRFELNVINGLSWPRTERLTYTTGDTARWRVINAGGDAHVMHLHGFHYRVTSHGDNRHDVIFSPGEGPLLVSEILVPGHTLSIEWLPTRPGNWIFHCHLQRHMSGAQRLDRVPGAQHASNGRHNADAIHHDMAGLIIGVSVHPGPGYVHEDQAPRHRLRLFANVRERVFGEHPGYGFVLQEDEREPGPDSVRVPGTTLLLRRGEPTEIVVHNRIGKPLAVHWHGLELESYFDGVAGWSGMPGRIAPPIAPGDSFTVRITPPRAGTFMYHVHGGGPLDLASGLYGAFIVLPPDRPRALPETDRVFVVSRLPGNDTATVINGTRTPDPVHVRMGETYRFRFIGIMPQEGDFIALRDPAGIARWELIARDGVDGGAARVPGLSAGMTLDYGLTASAPGEVVLEIETIDLLGQPLQRPIRIPVWVSANRSGSTRLP